jgi:DNA-binding MarR family transcriptional regulator
MASEAAAGLSALGAYRLDEQVGFHLRRAGQRHAHIFAEGMPNGLTPTQWAALVKLAELGPLSQNLLGRETAMDAATIKGVVDRLLRRALVSTAPDPADARRMLVSLSPAGREAVEQGVAHAAAITAETLKPLSPAERRQLLHLLQRIA